MSILISLIKGIFSGKSNQSEISAVKNLGVILQEQHWIDEKIAAFREELLINPNSIDALFNLAVALNIQKQEDEALSYFRRVVELDPQHYAARLNILSLKQKRYDWTGDEADTILDLRKAVSEPRITSRNHLNPSAFLTLPGSTAEEQKRCAERWAQIEYQPPASVLAMLGFGYNPTSHKKIRLGYLSGDFHQHPVSFQIAEIFERHDRNRFHISAYSYGLDDGSVMRKRLEKSFDEFVDLRDSSIDEAAKKINSDQIDILVDLKGYTLDERSAILALRPAPVQVNFLGYPGTMGANFVDYLIADRFTIPPESCQHYTEKVVWLPDCFMPNDSKRQKPASPSRSDCGLPEDAFVFCCFHQVYKITPQVFDVWCRLLTAIPSSVLWLTASNSIAEANLRCNAEQLGIDGRRIIMAPRLPAMEAHLARLQCADLFLDTLPYNAHATCSDALWMGLPVVTCAGETFPSRVAGSLLTAIGTPEMITYNLEDYYLLALDLATNRKKLAAIRSKILANRETSPLFDSVRFTRNLEQAYIKMIGDFSEKSGPHSN